MITFSRSDRLIICFLVLFFVYTKKPAAGQLVHDSCRFYTAFNAMLETGAEYFSPLKGTSQISTFNMNALFWKKQFSKLRILINTGLTVTYGWGEVTLYDNISLTPVETIHTCSAYGAGPVFQIWSEPVRMLNRISIETVGNGAIILYNRDFPYGGDRYNFMFRAGASLVFRYNRHHAVKLGYRWMHVSNGQGVGDHNPGFDAEGINLGWVTYFG